MSETVQIVNLICTCVAGMFGAWITYRMWRVRQHLDSNSDKLDKIHDQTNSMNKIMRDNARAAGVQEQKDRSSAARPNP
jgi:hypothetical protein